MNCKQTDAAGLRSVPLAPVAPSQSQHWSARGRPLFFSTEKSKTKTTKHVKTEKSEIFKKYLCFLKMNEAEYEIASHSDASEDNELDSDEEVRKLVSIFFQFR